MDRRAKWRLGAMLVLSLGAPSPAASAAEGPGRPNRPPDVVVILADDMGFSDVGCYGGEIRTPHLDRLAANGLRFTQFYNAGRCCPTRASLLTGLYPHQAGVGHMLQDFGRPAYSTRINDRSVTIAEALRPAGYRTLMAGKWHVGGKRPGWPVDRGFDRYFGLVSGGSNYWKLEPHRPVVLDDKRVTGAEIEGADALYLTDAFTDYAIRFIDEHAEGHADKPFFLHLAYTAPHWPLHARPEDVARYKGKYLAGWDALRKQRHERMVEQGLIDAKWQPAPRDPEVPAWDSLGRGQQEAWDLKMAVYAAQIDRMDQGIGRVVAKLEQLRRLDNTLIMFLADNGGCAEAIDRGQPGAPPGPKESFLSYGVGWAGASNTPFRLYKHFVHEGGIATPLIAHWPAVIRDKSRGALTPELGHVMDLMPTCLEAAGAEYPKTRGGTDVTPAEGKSLLPLLKGTPRGGHDALFWEHEGNRAVREGKWKLVALHNRPWELYDIEADRTELHDLAAEQSDRVNGMSKRYDEWAARCGVVPPEHLRAPAKPKATK